MNIPGNIPGGQVTTAGYSEVKSRFDYVALMPQARFLDFVARRAARLPGFELRLGAKVHGLLDGGGEHELPATLVVAAGGRFSKIRTLAGLPVHSLGAQNDLRWFRLPHRDSDPPSRFGPSRCAPRSAWWPRERAGGRSRRPGS